MTRRTQNSQESIDSQKGAGQPVQLQAVSVEHHRRRIARRPVGARAQQLRRRLSGKLHPRAACCRIQGEATPKYGSPAPTSATILDLYWSTPSGGSQKPMKNPSNQEGAEWPEWCRPVERVLSDQESAEQPWITSSKSHGSIGWTFSSNHRVYLLNRHFSSLIFDVFFVLGIRVCS